jgi:hypothetical protein
LGGVRKKKIYISGSERSQAVPARPSGRGAHIIGIGFLFFIFFNIMPEGLHYGEI